MKKEMRLIDANDAVKLLRGKCVAKYPSTFLMGLLASATEIEQMPTVDALEVVRCKDCNYFGGHGMCYCHAADEHGTPIFVREDDYCSYGERKDNDG